VIQQQWRNSLHGTARGSHLFGREIIKVEKTCRDNPKLAVSETSISQSATRAIGPAESSSAALVLDGQNIREEHNVGISNNMSSGESVANRWGGGGAKFFERGEGTGQLHSLYTTQKESSPFIKQEGDGTRNFSGSCNGRIREKENNLLYIHGGILKRTRKDWTDEGGTRLLWWAENKIASSAGEAKGGPTGRPEARTGRPISSHNTLIRGLWGGLVSTRSARIKVKKTWPKTGGNSLNRGGGIGRFLWFGRGVKPSERE